MSLIPKDKHVYLTNYLIRCFVDMEETVKYIINSLQFMDLIYNVNYSSLL